MSKLKNINMFVGIVFVSYTSCFVSLAKVKKKFTFVLIFEVWGGAK